MKGWFRKGIFGVLVLAGFVSSGTALADSNQISITNPTPGETVINTNAQISGKAPQNTIVTVTILDTDTNVNTIAHEPNGRVEGTVTTDSNGDWTYVPQTQLVPGRFSVQASYTTPQNQSMQSATVDFVVVNALGSSEQLSTTALRQFLIVTGSVLSVIVIVVVVLIRRYIRKKRGITMANTHSQSPKNGSSETPDKTGKQITIEETREVEADEPLAPLFTRTEEGREYVRRLDAEAKSIEEELLRAAERLEQTNAQVSALRGHLTEQKDTKP